VTNGAAAELSRHRGDPTTVGLICLGVWHEARRPAISRSGAAQTRVNGLFANAKTSFLLEGADQATKKPTLRFSTRQRHGSTLSLRNMPQAISRHARNVAAPTDRRHDAANTSPSGAANATRSARFEALPGPSPRSRATSRTTDPRQRVPTMRGAAQREAIPSAAIPWVLNLRDSTVRLANKPLFSACVQAQMGCQGSVGLAERYIRCITGLHAFSKQTYSEPPDPPFVVYGMKEATVVLALIATKWGVETARYAEKHRMQEGDAKNVRAAPVPPNFFCTFAREKEELLAEVDAHFAEWLNRFTRAQPRDSGLRLTHSKAIERYGAEREGDRVWQGAEYPQQFTEAKNLIKAALAVPPTEMNGGPAAVNPADLSPREEMALRCAEALAPNCADMIIGRQIFNEILRTPKPLRETAARVLQRGDTQMESRPQASSPAGRLILRTALLNPRIVF